MFLTGANEIVRTYSTFDLLKQHPYYVFYFGTRRSKTSALGRQSVQGIAHWRFPYRARILCFQFLTATPHPRFPSTSSFRDFLVFFGVDYSVFLGKTFQAQGRYLTLPRCMHFATGENHALKHTSLKEIAFMGRISRPDADR
jgi:hypothetical protein